MTTQWSESNKSDKRRNWRTLEVAGRNEQKKKTDRENERVGGGGKRGGGEERKERRAERNVSRQLSGRTKPKKRATIAGNTIRR